MTNDKFKPSQNLAPVHEQFILAEQNLTAEQKQNIVDSYQAEYNAEVVQGSQYGPGRRDFREFCRKIKDSLGATTVIGRISYDSDEYQPGKNYAGVIVYAMDGEFIWMNSGGDTRGLRGRSFYVIIKCTDNLPPEACLHPGVVHGYLIYKAFGIDLTIEKNRVCAGGFAWMPTRNPESPLRINSWALNAVNQEVCQSDGSGALSYEEKELVKYCWEQYTLHEVARSFEIPLIQVWNENQQQVVPTRNQSINRSLQQPI